MRKVRSTVNYESTHLMSSSLAKMMTTRALGFSVSLRIILSNSPVLGSRGIFTDCEMQRPPNWMTKEMHFQIKQFYIFFYKISGKGPLDDLLTPISLWSKLCLLKTKCLAVRFFL